MLKQSYGINITYISVSFSADVQVFIETIF